MNTDKLKSIIDDARERGYNDIRIRDILYLVLKHHLGFDRLILYKSLFDSSADENIVNVYESDEGLKYVSEFIEIEALRSKSASSSRDITFDENKAKMIALLDKVNEQLLNGDIKSSEALKMEIDIRTKLNDKFETNKGNEAQMIHIMPKSNFICPHVGNKECYIATKEDLIKKYGLVSMSDIEKKYTLIPKN